MKSILNIIMTATLLLSTFIAPSYSYAGYKVLSHDYILAADQIKIKFDPSIIKESAKISFQPCQGCQWIEAQSYKDTEYFHQYEIIPYKKFKQKVKSFLHNPPKGGYKILISVDTRNNNIFNIKWNYVEL